MSFRGTQWAIADDLEVTLKDGKDAKYINFILNGGDITPLLWYPFYFFLI